MKLPSFNLSITDFLCYFVPGTVMLSAVVVLLIMTPLSEYISVIRSNLLTGIVAFAAAYFLGVIVSSFTFSCEYLIYKNSNDPRNTLDAVDDLKVEVLETYNTLFKPTNAWTNMNFYLARSFVRESTIEIAQFAERQNCLRQFRRNNMIPVLMWGFTGIAWGLRIIHYSKPNDLLIWGVLLIIMSVLLTWFIIQYFLIHGMRRNRNREVREILMGLIVAKMTQNKNKS